VNNIRWSDLEKGRRKRRLAVSLFMILAGFSALVAGVLSEGTPEEIVASTNPSPPPPTRLSTPTPLPPTATSSPTPVPLTATLTPTPVPPTETPAPVPDTPPPTATASPLPTERLTPPFTPTPESAAGIGGPVDGVAPTASSSNNVAGGGVGGPPDTDQQNDSGSEAADRTSSDESTDSSQEAGVTSAATEGQMPETTATAERVTEPESLPVSGRASLPQTGYYLAGFLLMLIGAGLLATSHERPSRLD
jgi:hypothetical protein